MCAKCIAFAKRLHVSMNVIEGDIVRSVMFDWRRRRWHLFYGPLSDGHIEPRDANITETKGLTIHYYHFHKYMLCQSKYVRL